jgi:hypothetical protein
MQALMTFQTLSKIFRFCSLALLAGGILSQSLFAQGPLPDSPTPSSVEPVTPVVMTPSFTEAPHRFWDRQNQVLFAATVALNGADFAVTRANLQSGGHELNPVVRMFGSSTTGLAVNFVGETAGVIGISYFFHKTGHHQLERAVSVVNLGGSAFAVGYGLSHR